MDGIFSLDAARDIQVKHGRLLRDLDRIWSILPRALAEKFMRPATRRDLKGRERRGYALLPRGIPFLFMGQATRAQILWVARADAQPGAAGGRGKHVRREPPRSGNAGRGGSAFPAARCPA